MSNSTTSPSSRCAQSCASTPPICPPPINAIFFLAMVVSLGGVLLRDTGHAMLSMMAFRVGLGRMAFPVFAGSGW